MPILYGQVNGRKRYTQQPEYVPKEETKKCKRCYQEKPISEFNFSKAAKDKHRSICKKCESEAKSLKTYGRYELL